MSRLPNSQGDRPPMRRSDPRPWADHLKKDSPESKQKFRGRNFKIKIGTDERKTTQHQPRFEALPLGLAFQLQLTIETQTRG